MKANEAPEKIYITPHFERRWFTKEIKYYYAPNLQKEDGKYSIAYGDDELLCIADNPVDACYEMILKLNELKML